MQGFSMAIISIGKGNTLPRMSFLKFSQNKRAPFGSFNYDSNCLRWSWGSIFSQFVCIIIFPYSISPLKIIEPFITTTITASLDIKLHSVSEQQLTDEQSSILQKATSGPCAMVS